MAYYTRKATRLPKYDYATPNYYFITICTHEKKCIFGQPGKLNAYGKIAEECVKKIEAVFPSVDVDNYVVMPNHIHMILALKENGEETNISTVIGQYKATVTKKIAESKNIWQRSFHDHIIRNQTSYEKIWNYVEYNAAKWEQDCFYSK